MGDTALSGVVGVGVWVTLIIPKVNTCICVTHNKRVHTVTYSEEVRRGKGELIQTFRTLRRGLLTFAHRDDQGQVTNFNHQL